MNFCCTDAVERDDVLYLQAVAVTMGYWERLPEADLSERGLLWFLLFSRIRPIPMDTQNKDVLETSFC